jgi:predicted RNase H-like nuclease
LNASSYLEAHRRAVENSRHRKGMSKQAFAVVAKIRDVDAVMSPERQERIVEGHPELSFVALTDGRPLVGRARAVL